MKKSGLKKYCLLVMLFAPLMCGYAGEETLEKINSKNPLIRSFGTSEGRCVSVSGSIEYRKGFSKRAAILVVNFYDAAGKDVVRRQEFQTPQGHRFVMSTWVKGHYSYLPGDVKAIPFCFDINVPRRAVSCKIRVGSMDKQEKAILKDFSMGEYSRGRPFYHLSIALLLIGISLITALILRRKVILPENSSCELADGFRIARRIGAYGVVAFCVLMALLFLGQAYSAVARCEWGNLLSFSSAIGEALFVALLSAMLYYATNGRRWLIVGLILLISLLVNVTVIHLTHSLYLQNMAGGFWPVGSCLNASAVNGLYEPLSFRWCNYELFCSLRGKVFFKDVRVAQYLNVFCATAAAYPVFRLAEKTAGVGMAIFVTLLMGLSPVLSVFAMIVTGDFLSAAAYMYALYFLMCGIDEERFVYRMRDFAISGLFMGVGQLLKPMATIFILMLVAMSLINILRQGRRSFLVWLAMLTMIFGVYVVVGKCGQDVIIEVAKPLRIDPEPSLYRGFLMGLNAETHGEYNRELSLKIQGMTRDEQRRAVKDLIKTKWRSFPALFGEKLDTLYSNPSFAWTFYDRSIAPSTLPGWVKNLMSAWNFLMLLLVGVGAAGLAVSWRRRKNDIGTAAVFVVVAFTAISLVVEVGGQYKMALYPIYFLIIPYAGEWFKMGAPLRIRLEGLMRRIGVFVKG